MPLHSVTPPWLGTRVPYGLAMLDGDAAGNNLLHASAELSGAALLQSPPLLAALNSLLGASTKKKKRTPPSLH